MDSEDPIAATFVHDVEGTESAVDETTPTDSIVPGVEVALGNSAAPQDLVIPPSRAARLSTEPPGGSGRPESFMVHGGSRFGFLIGWAVGVLVVVAIVDWSDSWGADPGLDWLVFGGLALVSLFAAYRAFRRGVGADPAGVTVVNFLGTHRIPWQDIREITYRWHSSFNDEKLYALEFLLTSGGAIPAVAPSGSRARGGRLDLLRDRISAAAEAALPGQFEPRPATEGKAQVVEVHRSRLEPANVVVAIIIRLPSGRYRHRRVECSGDDLTSALAYFFDPNPAFLVHGGQPSAPRNVLDQDFDTLEEALGAAVRHDLPADSDGWLDEVEFRSHVQTGEIAESIRPEGEYLRWLDRVGVGMTFLIVVVAVSYLGYRIDVWVGLYAPENRGAAADGVFALIVTIASFGLAGWAGFRLAGWFERRNLTREIALQGRPPQIGPQSPHPEPSQKAHGPAVTWGQDVPGTSRVHQDCPQDVQDTVDGS